MKKFLRFSLVALFAVLGMSNAMAQEVTLDFTLETESGSKVSVWGFPAGSSNKTVDEQSFTYDGYTVKVAGSTGNGYYWHDKDHYLLFGKQGAYVTLPAFSFDVERIDIEIPGSASGKVTQNIFVGDNAVSTETTGNGTKNFLIASDKQAAGTIYTIKVTNAYNSQIKKILIWKKGTSGDQKLQAGIAWSKPTASVTYGNADDTYQYLPTFQNPNNLTGITFSSDNSDAVSISTDGEIEVEGVGEATLTASFAGNDQYEAAEVTCKVTVKEAEPVDPEIETVNTFPYEEAFSNSLGKFYIKDVTLPEGLTYIWAKNNSYVKASAYKSGNYASESWLISPYIDLTSTTAPAFTFNHALNKFNSVDEMKEQATLWIKEKDGDWTQLSGMNYTENKDWTFISAGEFDLSSYKGKTIQIGFKYVSTTTSAGTWEIKEFALTDGEEDPNVKGGENNPYTVEEIMAFDPDNAESLPATKVWVKGYIAGCVNTEKGNELSTGEAVASNIGLSSTGVVTSVIPVQLPTGAVRTALNIVDTPANVGKEVLVYGNIVKYCGVAGVKNTSEYKFTGNSTEIDTGISALTIDTDVNAPMYNLKGERVDANYRGVVIKGGKKTIQK